MSIEKIYPTIEELTAVETTIKCPEPECTAIFRCKSNLNLHLARHHNNEECSQRLQKTVAQKDYHCPTETCIYHTQKCFKLMKYLRQHYRKVHATRKHKCGKCNLTFPTESLRKPHEDFCGVIFKCAECPAKYTCYDTLTTHTRRKNHILFHKIRYKELFEGDTNACSRIICMVDAKPLRRLILPKNLLLADESTNEETPIETKVESKGVKRKRKGNEMHTQTQQFKAIFSSTETQTEVISVHTASIGTSMLGINKSLKKSIKTQTTSVTSSSQACNTSFDINQHVLEDSLLEVETNSLGTQTLSPNILSRSIPKDTFTQSCSTNTVTQVDQSIGTDDLLQSYINDIVSSSYCNADMETQTDWFSHLDLLSNDVQANNFTQTCDDILPPDLRFNNTHTQTVLNDILRSVGSQTTMRLNGSVFTNTETQTDSIFEELLQEINS